MYYICFVVVHMSRRKLHNKKVWLFGRKFRSASARHPLPLNPVYATGWLSLSYLALHSSSINALSYKKIVALFGRSHPGIPICVILAYSLIFHSLLQKEKTIRQSILLYNLMIILNRGT